MALMYKHCKGICLMSKRAWSVTLSYLTLLGANVLAQLLVQGLFLYKMWLKSNLDIDWRLSIWKASYIKGAKEWAWVNFWKRALPYGRTIQNSDVCIHPEKYLAGDPYTILMHLKILNLCMDILAMWGFLFLSNYYVNTWITSFGWCTILLLFPMHSNDGLGILGFNWWGARLRFKS